MKISDVQKILMLEYRTSDSSLSTLSMPTDKGTSGKNLDNIIAGVTKPYKAQMVKKTKQQKMFPHLAKIVDQLKKTTVNGDKIVVGQALKELTILLNGGTLKTDEDGLTILPIGKGARIIQRGGNYFIRLLKVDDPDVQKQNEFDVSQELPKIENVEKLI